MRARACRVFFSRRGRSAVEALFVVVFISILLLVAVTRYNSSVKSVRETALIVETANLRTAVNYYVMVNGKLPGSIKGLMKYADASDKYIEGEDYRVAILGKYVESMTLDGEGYPLDPFGNRYEYDSRTGRVRSSTKGYERW